MNLHHRRERPRHLFENRGELQPGVGGFGDFEEEAELLLGGQDGLGHAGGL